MNERQYQNKIIYTMRELGWQVQEHHDRVASHVPDLSFSAEALNGWAEIKLYKKKRLSNNFKAVGLTAGQRKFLLSTAQPSWLIIGHLNDRIQPGGGMMMHFIIPASEFRGKGWTTVMHSSDLFTLLDHAMAVALRDHIGSVG
jgi:hypothetical protein